MKKSSFHILWNIASLILVIMVVSSCTKDSGPDSNKDTEVPTIISVVPAEDMNSVPRNTVITVTFSEPVDTATINNSSFKLRRGAALVNGRITCSDTTATFTPFSRLEGSTVYTATVTAGIKDISDNSLTEDFIWSFETEVAPDENAPGVISVTPAASATQVSLTGRPSVTFNEPMNISTINSSTFLVKQGSTVIPGTIDFSENTAIFIPDVALESSKIYTVVLTSDVKDVAGNPLQSDYSWSFTTTAPADATKPVVSSVTPVANAVSVPGNVNPQITFSEPIDPLSISPTTFTLKQGSTVVPGTVTSSGSTATFSPTTPLSANTVYSATVTTGVKDIAGNTLASNYTWTFTTAASAPVDVTKPVVSSVNPAANAVSIPVSAKPQVTFSEPMDPATVSNTTFTLKQGSTLVPGTVTISGSSATFSPTGALSANTVYSATVTTGVKDIAGNTLASNYTWSFTTAASAPVDVTKPVISSVNPAANAVSIPVSGKPQVTFSEPMDPATISNSSFTLKQGSTVVPGTVTISGNTATFSPTSALSANTVYSATVTTGVKDIAGNTMASNYTWTFTTAASTPAAKSFAADVVPVLTQCNACHKHNWTPSSTPSTFHANLASSGHINLTTPTSGKIYSKLNGGHPSSGVTSEQKTTVLTWIKEGSKNN